VDLAPGTILSGRFRIEEAIGRGGYGVVYRATQLEGDRQVALKVLHPDLVRTDEGRRRFEREAELARRLRHPNTVYLYDFGSDEQGNGFIVYELLRGRPLAALLEGTTGLTADRVARIAAQVLRALGEAHGLGIVHRDVKPSNIFLAEYAGERDYVKLLDFGIAKDLSTTESTRLTQTGQTLGTPHYMAPEQITAKPSTPATDLYAVGLVMAEMITGAVVYQGTAIQVLAQQLSNEPTPLSRQVQEHRFGPLIQRATLKDASQRYASANEMLEHLEHIERATHRAPTPAPPPTAAPQMAPPAWRPPPMAPQLVAAPFAPKPASSGGAIVAVVVFALLLLLMVGGGFAYMMLVRSAPAPAAPAKTKVPDTPTAEPTAIPTPPTSASSGPSEADERRRLWLTTSLKGHDNSVAALRKATISESDAGAFRVTINNQFGFTCDLTFSEEGRPQELRKCASREGWGAHNPPDNVIKLTCTETDKDEVCKGSYFLSNQGFSSKEEMQLIRPKGGAAEPATAPPPPAPTTKPQLPGPPPLPPAPTSVLDER